MVALVRIGSLDEVGLEVLVRVSVMGVDGAVYSLSRIGSGN